MGTRERLPVPCLILPRLAQQIEKRETEMIGSEEKAPERGAASLFIELRDGRIIVTHGTDKVELLNREAFTGDWDLLWKILRGENQVAPAEQSEPITAQDEFFKEQAERAVRSILQDHSLPVLWLSPEDFQQQDMDDENSRREDAGLAQLAEQLICNQ